VQTISKNLEGLKVTKFHRIDFSCHLELCMVEEEFTMKGVGGKKVLPDIEKRLGGSRPVKKGNVLGLSLII
jgi:hypothetical protein